MAIFHLASCPVSGIISHWEKNRNYPHHSINSESTHSATASIQRVYMTTASIQSTHNTTESIERVYITTASIQRAHTAPQHLYREHTQNHSICAGGLTSPQHRYIVHKHHHNIYTEGLHHHSIDTNFEHKTAASIQRVYITTALIQGTHKAPQHLYRGLPSSQHQSREHTQNQSIYTEGLHHHRSNSESTHKTTTSIQRG